MHTHPTMRALGALAALVLATLAGGLAMPSGANAAATASWYSFQTDSDRCYDVAQWWNGSRWTGYFWVDTNNDCTFGETNVYDSDGNGNGDQVWMRRRNSGSWAAAADSMQQILCHGENQYSSGGYQYERLGTYWSSCGYYQSSVGPPTNPSGAYNLALGFARQGYVY
jgi:hypothetical protein